MMLKYLTKDKVYAIIERGIKKVDFQERIGFFCSEQGYIYKSDKSFDELKDDEVCYMPEYYAEVNEKGLIVDVDIYTKADFMEICEDIKWQASALYEFVDWQHPETLYDETAWEEEAEYYEKNAMKCKPKERESNEL